ncbi:hypothetical protein LSH36_1045g00045 [Paralvinella palmiformis]|uniref:DUF4190 domain-containing protein n=1 Tax=Paralvinella palmiformis TaxID=53620 RepID=A0AAD9IXA7_9ANNE|nr:hypothetical protein LSH36_1045g00045 [Paralvinella palmiformis]
MLFYLPAVESGDTATKPSTLIPCDTTSATATTTTKTTSKKNITLTTLQVTQTNIPLKEHVSYSKETQTQPLGREASKLFSTIMAHLNKTNQQYQYADQSPMSDFSASAPQVVPITQSNIESNAVPWSWGSLITAMVSMLCCFATGIVATVMAVLSYVDHSTNQFERSKVKRLAAYGLAIAGFVIGAIIIIGVIIGLLVGVHQNYIY